jgi:TPR repeat protein
MDEEVFVKYFYNIVNKVIDGIEDLLLKEDVASLFLSTLYFDINNDMNRRDIYKEKLLVSIVNMKESIVNCIIMGLLNVYHMFNNNDISLTEEEIFYEKSIEWYNKALNNKTGLVECAIGNKYYNGNGVSRNKETALEWYMKGTEKGDGFCFYSVGFFYEKDLKDKEKALEFYLNGSDRNDYDCMVSASTLFEQLGDKEKSLFYLEKAAKDGHPHAMYLLGYRYLHGSTVTKNYNEAINWCLKSYNKNYNVVKSAEIIGFCYFKLNSYDEAIKYLKISRTSYSNVILGEVYEKQGHVNLAMDLYKSICDKEGLACYRLARYFFDKSYDQAKFYLNKGVNLKNVGCIDTYGKILLSENKINEGLKLLEENNVTPTINSFLIEGYLFGKIECDDTLLGPIPTNINKVIYYSKLILKEDLIILCEQCPILNNILLSDEYPNSFTNLSTNLQLTIIETCLCSDLPTEIEDIIVKFLIYQSKDENKYIVTTD